MENSACAPIAIRAVVFDAVGTVMYPEFGIAEPYCRAIRQHCGRNLSKVAVAATVRTALHARSSPDLRTSETAEREFWQTLVEQLCEGADGVQECFDDLFTFFGDAANWKCFDDTADTIAALTQAGMPCVIASNFDARLHPVCDGLPELSGVRQRIVSSEVGWRKPASEFFAAVCEQVQVPAENILMVGDDVTNDVRGALSAGMQAAWLCRDANLASAEADLATISSLTELIPMLIADSDGSDIQKAELRRD